MVAKIENGADFTTLVEESSCYPTIEGDLGWLPQELMPNSLIANATANLKPGEISQPIYDESASKNVGYWLIEVVDKNEEKGIKARAILLGSEQKSLEITAKLNGGENFTALAKEYSQHESKDKGGELGWVKQGDMNSEAFDEVAFKLPLAELSEPVQDKSFQTTSGYWIVEVLENGEHELSRDVREKLKTKHFNEWFQEQKESSTNNNYLDKEMKSWAVNKVI